MRLPTNPWVAASARSGRTVQGRCTSGLAARRRRTDLVARLDAELGRAATSNFHHHAHRLAGWDGRFVQRLGGRDPRDRAVRAYENHVERDQGVPHPEGDGLRWRIWEKHALIGCE